jgi:hypothetical protein
MKLEISRQIFEETSNIKFYQNPSSGSRVMLCRRTAEETNIRNLIFAFRNFANALKNGSYSSSDGEEFAQLTAQWSQLVSSMSCNYLLVLRNTVKAQCVALVGFKQVSCDCEPNMLLLFYIIRCSLLLRSESNFSLCVRL